jgi:hypothetical protein
VARAADAALIALVSLGPALAYLPGLGFYSDDWTMVGQFAMTPDQSLYGLLASSYGSHYLSRPVQGLYSALLYKAFGTQPLGYHVSGSLILAASAALVYVVLRRLGASRAAALAVGLVWAAMPNYTTARVWFAVGAAPLSLLLFLVAVLCDLQAWRAHGRGLVGWRLVALACLLASVMAYELVLPLALGLAGLGLVAPPGHGGPRQTWGRAAWFVLPTVILVLAVGAYKAERSGRLGAMAEEPARVQRILGNLFRPGTPDGVYGLNVPRAVHVNVVQHVLQAPWQAWHLRDRAGRVLPVLAVALALLAATTLAAAGRDGPWRAGPWLGLAAAGAAVFALGYAVFLTNTAIQITATGVGNRTALVASIGVALIVVGLLGALVAALPLGTWRSGVFGAGVAAYLACGMVLVGAVASFWTDAVPRQEAVLQSLDRALPVLPRKATLLVGGICPYSGPAVVFESSWDLAFALRMRRGDPTVSADLVGASFKVYDDRLETSLYGEAYPWPYGPATLMVDARTGRSAALAGPDAARAALVQFGLPDRSCPRGLEGVGVPVYR